MSVRAELAKIAFYNIEACGYYAFAQPTKEQFGGASTVLGDTLAWSAGKNFEDTLSPGSGDDAGTYLFDICQNSGGDFLVTTWNEAASTNGRVASVPRQATVGSGTVVMNKVSKNTIPGHATYFWVIPSKNVLATVTFQHSQNGQSAFQKYMESYLKWSSSFVVRDPSDRTKIIGYSTSPGNPNTPALDLYPRFRTKAAVNQAHHKDLVDNYARITKVIRKTLLNLRSSDDLELWQRFLRRAHMSAVQPGGTKGVPIQYQVSKTVSRSELLTMIKAWKDSSRTRYEDYGFVLKGDPKVYWLSHSLIKDEIELKVSRDNDEAVNGKSLIKALHSRASHLLQLF
ncbi:hypothetical protein [Pinirhizobacter soli]|uniref:hypothetical protein n=1 Tax=Pinirhizobacter soli TaxID=2786953 RepID=UPI002029F010|nr:hypothetical protein [Pinirhizobacter soli]